MEYEYDIYIKGIEAAVEDYIDNVGPFFDGYKPEFIEGYKYGQEMIKRVTRLIKVDNGAY